MLTLRSILCPVDFSPYSKDALRWAVAFAARYRSRLTIITAVDPLLAEAARTRLHLDLVKDETEPALGKFVREVLPKDAAWAPEVTLEVRVGPASDIIFEAAARVSSDLIAMGTQGLGGFRKVILGSTTERVLRGVRSPVLAVPPDAARGVSIDTQGARVDVGRILMATDFSATASTAFEWAVDLAHDLSAPLTVAHVIEPLNAPAEWTSYIADTDEVRVTGARGKLEQLSQQAAHRERVDTVVSLGRPADEIAGIAEDRGAGLVVVGLTGAQGPLAPRPGSIAYRVLGLSAVPVVVVPPRSL
jgi:universal stress protein A